MAIIAPSLLSSDFAHLAQQIASVEEAGAQLLHLDVMDGHFVPDITIGPPVVKAIRAVTKLKLDVHLMIEHPERMISRFIAAGADYITVHQETCPHLDRVIQLIKEQHCQAGVVLNPATPVSLIADILHLFDIVLLMSVNPGAGGQSFIPYVSSKITHLKSLIINSNLQTQIEVDGGIKEHNLRMVAEAGADIIVVGSGIYENNKNGKRLPPGEAFHLLNSMLIS